MPAGRTKKVAQLDPGDLIRVSNYRVLIRGVPRCMSDSDRAEQVADVPLTVLYRNGRESEMVLRFPLGRDLELIREAGEADPLGPEDRDEGRRD